jgi:hypothetical protein
MLIKKSPLMKRGDTDASLSHLPDVGATYIAPPSAEIGTFLCSRVDTEMSRDQALDSAFKLAGYVNP